MKFAQKLRGSNENDGPKNFTMTDELSLDKNQSENVTLLTKNFQIIVTFSRLLGCHPHPIFCGNSLKTTILAKLWSIVWIIVIATSLGFSLHDFVLCRMGINADNLCTFAIAYRITILSGFALSSVISVIRAEKYEKAIARIQEFDGATFFKTKVSVVENFVALGALILSWGYIVSSFGGRHVSEIMTMDLMTIIYLIGICVLSLEIYKFCFLFAAVLRRFVLLKRITLSGKIDIKSTKGVYHQPLTVQNVFILNYRLAEAVENFNRYYDVQIVYWLAYSISDLITQVFVLANTTRGTNIEPSLIGRFAFSLYHPVLICTVSHFTCKRANELGTLLFGYKAPSLVTTVSSLESLEFGFWLFQQPLKITGLKLFYVDLPLLLSIIEASATYSTFILQNAWAVYRQSQTNDT